MKALTVASLTIALTMPLLADDSDGSVRLVASPPAVATSSPRYVAAPGQHDLLGVQETQDGFLVAWNEFSGWPTFVHRRIRVSRVRADGSIVDPTGLDVGGMGASSVAMLPEGDTTRLYWAEPAGYDLQLQTCTVDERGVVGAVEVLGAPLEEGSYRAVNAERTAFGDYVRIGRYLLRVDRARIDATLDFGGWGEPSSLTTSTRVVVATWVTSDGVLMFQRVSGADQIEGPPGGTAIASGVRGAGADGNGSAVLIVYSTDIATKLVRLDPETGEITDAGTIPVPNRQPLVVWNGSKFIVAWNHGDELGLVGIDVPESGVPPFAPRVLVSRAGAPIQMVAGGESILVADRRGYCLGYRCEFDVWLSRLSRDASSPAEGSLLVSAVAAPQYGRQTVQIGGGFIALWSEPGGLFSAPMKPGEAAEPVVVPLGMIQDTATMASDGTRALVLAIGRENGVESFLRGVFLDGGGNVLGERTSVSLADRGVGLVAASSGMGFLAAWRSGGGGVIAVRIDGAGRVLDDPPIELGPAANDLLTVAAAWDGGGYVVVWADREGNDSNSERMIRAVRVTTSGAVMAAGIPVRSATALLDPAIACGGGDCLLTWTRSSTASVSGLDVEGVFLRGGTLIVNSGLVQIAGSEGDGFRSVVAWSGRSFFVVWFARDPDGSAAYVVRSTVLELDGGVTTMREPLSLGRVRADRTASIACEASLGCVELHVAPVDDSVHGNAERLFKVFLRLTRPRGIRR